MDDHFVTKEVICLDKEKAKGVMIASTKRKSQHCGLYLEMQEQAFSKGKTMIPYAA